jgi:deoxyribonuclease-4
VILGAHLSVAGGVDKALERAGKFGFPTVAIFVRNQLQWRAPPLAEETVGSFRAARRRLGIAPVIAHGSYLVNLAGAGAVRRRSMRAVADELDRCERLGVEYYVLHPGSPGPAGRDRGIARVAEALNAACARAPRAGARVLLETTAGTGATLGGRLKDLAEILSRLERRERFGICLDTCHVFAAGYDLRAPPAYRATMAAVDASVGLERLMCVHLNDSVFQLGSRRDRHAHIGSGRIGLAGFANIVSDARLRDVPMILETPKGFDPAGRDWDLVNAETIRALAARSGGQRPLPPGRGS